MNLGAPELLIVLVIVLLLFGPARLPSLARSLGEATRALRDGAAADDADPPRDHGPEHDAGA